MNVANKFNSFFTNVEKNLNKEINLPHDKSFKDYLINRYNLKFTFQNIDDKNVITLIILVFINFSNLEDTPSKPKLVFGVNLLIISLTFSSSIF